MPILFLNEELCSFILQLLSNLGCSLPGNFWQIHLYSCAHSSAQPTSVWTKKSTAHLFLRTLNFLSVYLLFSSNFSGAKDKINRSLVCQALYQELCKTFNVNDLIWPPGEPYGDKYCHHYWKQHRYALVWETGKLKTVRRGYLAHSHQPVHWTFSSALSSAVLLKL